MTTTASAQKAAENPPAKKDEKVEKRRALGRGLESLLPGPRVVAAAADSAGNVPGTAGTRAGVPGPHPTWADSREQTIEIRAVADEAFDGLSDEEQNPRAGAPAPHTPGEGITLQAMAAEPAARGISIRQIPIASIDENPYQTRYLFSEEALAELADSIKECGVLQPIIVRPGEEEGRYTLVLGERRHRASKLAGMDTIPAIVRRVSEQQAAEMTLIENLQREDLNCMEQAEAFRVLSKEFEMTQEEIGKRVGMSRESVSNYMRLLRLPEKVMEYLATDRLSFSEARELLGLHDASKIQEAADVVVGKHMSLEEIENLVAKYNGWPDAQDPARKPGVGGARWQDPNVRAAQTELEQLLRVRVRIKDRRGKGRIVIDYATVDDYERVLGMLKGKK
ncbi:MAG: ParB/RepB/Spo0J family partition protein [Candidatus Sulfotelmatobacter sp.]